MVPKATPIYGGHPWIVIHIRTQSLSLVLQSATQVAGPRARRLDLSCH